MANICQEAFVTWNTEDKKDKGSFCQEAAVTWNTEDKKRR